jgi:cytochrome c-type biogenesis protein CcmH
MNRKLPVANYRWLGILITFAVLSPFFAAPAHAQGPNIDDQVNRIGNNLYCPVCPNTPLDQCATQACVQWRAQIKEMLLIGQSEQQIRDYFVSQYGERVLGAPPAQGFNWLAYILPAVALLIGAAIVWFALRNRIVRGAGESPEAMPIPSEYAERVEQELKED